MKVKNTTAQHVAIPGTSISLRPWRTTEVPEGSELPVGIIEIKESIPITKKYNKKGDDE